jgi:hypothetical protein
MPEFKGISHVGLMACFAKWRRSPLLKQTDYILPGTFDSHSEP